MRLDKFLKVSRMLKRRTLAKELADRGRVLVNGRPAKPSTEVGVGDVLTLAFGEKTLEVEVLELRAQASVAAARAMTRVLRETLRPPSE